LLGSELTGRFAASRDRALANGAGALQELRLSPPMSTRNGLWSFPHFVRLTPARLRLARSAAARRHFILRFLLGRREWADGQSGSGRCCCKGFGIKSS